ncbi:MAG TPA: DUF4328 domain-containing protein [Gemmataceae bacterium]|nr:DUF4328 domain-containing protein [Gemmataceae bacterium]
MRPLSYEALSDQLPGQGLALVVMVFLALNAAADVGATILDAAMMASPAAAAAFTPGRGQAVAGADEPLNPMNCVQFIIYVPTGILFLIWMHRSYKNLTLFGVRGLEYSPGWAVGAFFVPILNLFRPCQIAQEMWRASDPDAPPDPPDAWQQSSNSGVIGVWWGFWLVATVFGYVAALMSRHGDMAQEGFIASIASDALWVVAALMAILFVKQTRDRQVQKLQTLKEE